MVSQVLRRVILGFLAILYGLAIRGRNFLWDRELLKEKKLERPVISIGNLTAGGTGKTPLVAWLAQRLIQHGFRPVILSRGYRGAAERSNLVVNRGGQLQCGPEECGDEPFLLASQLPAVPVVVGKNRFGSAQLLQPIPPSTIFILDDGYQHRRLARDINFLLLDATDPFGGEELLPQGTLREPLSAMKRADAILITRIHLLEDPSRLSARVASLAPKARVFKSGHHIRNFYSPQNGQTIDRQRLQDMKTGVLAAIGNPLVFLKDLKRAGIRPQKRFFFRDHHVFQARELKEVAARCQQVGITTLLTTEKDAVRMQATHLSGIELCVVAIRAYVEDEGSLDEWLLQKLSETAGLDSMKTPQPPLVT